MQNWLCRLCTSNIWQRHGIVKCVAKGPIVRFVSSCQPSDKNGNRLFSWVLGYIIYADLHFVTASIDWNDGFRLLPCRRKQDMDRTRKYWWFEDLPWVVGTAFVLWLSILSIWLCSASHPSRSISRSIAKGLRWVRLLLVRCVHAITVEMISSCLGYI